MAPERKRIITQERRVNKTERQAPSINTATASATDVHKAIAPGTNSKKKVRPMHGRFSVSDRERRLWIDSMPAANSLARITMHINATEYVVALTRNIVHCNRVAEIAVEFESASLCCATYDGCNNVPIKSSASRMIVPAR